MEPCCHQSLATAKMCSQSLLPTGSGLSCSLWESLAQPPGGNSLKLTGRQLMSDSQGPAPTFARFGCLSRSFHFCKLSRAINAQCSAVELKTQDSRALAQDICFLDLSLEPSPRAVPSREPGIEETLFTEGLVCWVDYRTLQGWAGETWTTQRPRVESSQNVLSLPWGSP